MDRTKNAEKNQNLIFLFIKKYFSIMLMIILFILFTAINPVYCRPRNLLNILEQSSVILVCTLGTTIVIASGSIDLSIGSVLGLSATVAAMCFKTVSLLGIPIALVVGLCCGLVNGLIYTYTKIPSFIATMGMMTLLRGTDKLICGAQTVLINLKLVRTFAKGNILIVPNIFLVYLILLAVYGTIYALTPFGRNVLAIGGNEEVANLCGIKVNKHKVLMYVMNGFACAVAGILAAIRMGASAPDLGDGYELDVIAAVVLGGGSLSGGVGKLSGSLIGGLIMGMLANGMNIIGINANWQLVVRGAVVILAVILSIERSSQRIVK